MAKLKRKPESDPLCAAVCRVIRKHRITLGMSQQELAEKSGLHRTYISDVERGARNISLKSFARLAAALDQSPSTIVQAAELDDRCHGGGDRSNRQLIRAS